MKFTSLQPFYRFFFIVTLMLGVFLVPSVAAADEGEKKTATSEKNSIVAEVNGEKIYRETLERELRRHLQGKLLAFDEAEQHQLKKKMLGMMVTRALLLQQAKKKKVLPTADEVDEFLGGLKISFGSQEEFEKQMSEFGLSEEEFRNGLVEDLSIQYYLERVVLKGIEVKDKDVKHEYDSAPEKYRAPEEAKVRHILLRLKEDASEEEESAVRKRAEEIREQALGEGADFASLARNFSEALNKGKGGALEFFTKGQMDPAFSKAAFALELGKISEVVKSSYGYHVIKLEQRRGGEIPAFSEVKERIYKSLLNARQQQAVVTHVSGLRKESKVIVYFQ